MGLSTLGYLILNNSLIQKMVKTNIRSGIHSTDLYYKGTNRENEIIAESVGLAPAIVYFAILLVLYTLVKLMGISPWDEYVTNTLTYVTFGTFLGFVDDVLELRWRDKFVYPFIFSLPMIMSFQGESKVMIP